MRIKLRKGRKKTKPLQERENMRKMNSNFYLCETNEWIWKKTWKKNNRKIEKITKNVNIRTKSEEKLKRNSYCITTLLLITIQESIFCVHLFVFFFSAFRMLFCRFYVHSLFFCRLLFSHFLFALFGKAFMCVFDSSDQYY